MLLFDQQHSEWLARPDDDLSGDYC